MLLDRDNALQFPHEPAPAWDAALWAGWAWMRLYDVDKYLRRGSHWEALLKLEEARALLLRHHAATTDVPDPEFGITSLVDAGGDVPVVLEERWQASIRPTSVALPPPVRGCSCRTTRARSAIVVARLAGEATVR